jgi:hypothetical protein
MVQKSGYGLSILQTGDMKFIQYLDMNKKYKARKWANLKTKILLDQIKNTEVGMCYTWMIIGFF